MRSKVHLVLLLLLAASWSACDDGLMLPDIPEVKSVTVENLNGVKGDLLIEFQDGDGDLGLSDIDTLSPRNFVPLTCIIDGEEVELFTRSSNEAYYNLVIDFQAWIDTGWVDIDPCESLLLSRRVPIPEPEGQDKTLIGEMDYPNVDIFLLNDGPDTVRLGVRLIDQALNNSETVYSDMLIRP